MLQARVEALRDCMPSKMGRATLELSTPLGSSLRLHGLAQGDLAAMDWSQGIPAATVRQGRGAAGLSISLWDSTTAHLELGVASSPGKPIPEGEAGVQAHLAGWSFEGTARERRGDDTVRVRQLEGKEFTGEAAVGWSHGDVLQWELRGNRRFLAWRGGSVVRWSAWSWFLVRLLSWEKFSLRLGAAGAWADSSRDLHTVTGSEPIPGGYRYLDGNDPVFAPLDQWQAQGLASASITLAEKAFVTLKGSAPLWMRARKTSLWPEMGTTVLPEIGGSSSWTRRGGGPWEESARLDLGLSDATWMALEASASRGDDYWYQKVTLSIQTSLP